MFLARKNLQWRFLTLLLPVVVLGLLAMSLVGQYFLREAFDRDVRSGLSAELQSRSLHFSTSVRAMDRALIALASTPVDERVHQGTDHDADFIHAWSHDASVLLRQWEEVDAVYLTHESEAGIEAHVATRDGVVISTWRPGEEPDWATAHRKTRAGQILHHAPGDEGPRLLLSRPLLAVQRARIGLHLVDPLPARILAGLNDREGSFGVIFNDEGRRLHPADADPWARHLDEFSSHVNAYAVPVTPVELDDQDYFVTARHDAALGLSIGYFVPRDPITADLERMTTAMAVTLGAMTFFAGLVILVMARRVARPLEGVINTMERVAAGDLHERLPIDGPEEMVRLSRSFNSMISDLHTTHAALRSQSERLTGALAEVENVEAMKDSFLALVSHEVRTPLTSIMGGVEFLRSEFSERHDETETEFMEIIYDSAKRLSGFMNDAIMMAQLQANRGRGSFDPFSFSALVETQLADLSAEIEKRSLALRDRTVEQGEALVVGDWTLLQVALQKVLHNACRHNVDGGEIEIEVTDRILEGDGPSLERLMTARGLSLPDETQRWMAMRVFNTGPLLSDERIDSLFQRFELTHDIDNHQKGSGLSLPIAHYILLYHGGAIEVRAVGDRGMAFYLVLPLRQSPSARRYSNPVPEGVDTTVATAHLVKLAAAEVEELERQIAEEDAARRSGPVAPVSSDPNWPFGEAEKQPLETSPPGGD